MDDEVDRISQKMVEDAVALLKSHFDQVQVFAIREEAGSDAVAWEAGYGDIYARVGVVKHWADDPNGFATE